MLFNVSNPSLLLRKQQFKQVRHSAEVVGMVLIGC